MIEGVTRRRFGESGPCYLADADWPEAPSVVTGSLQIPEAMTDGRLRLPLEGEQHFYGLGESGQQFDRLGAARRLWNSQGNHGSGADVAIPLLLSTAGYALFFDNSSRAWITPGDSVGPSAAIEYYAEAPGLDLYVITGRDLCQVLERATALLGRPALPPRWALGFMQSSRFFHDTEELRGILRRMREDRLPCDAFIFLSTYHHGMGWNRGVGHLEFNPVLAPDPEALLAEMRDSGFRVFSHEYPALHADSPLHEEAAAKRYLLDYGYPDQRPHADGATNYREGQRFLDFSNPEVRRWWWDAHRDLVAMGIEGWWLDGGEGPPAETKLHGGSGLELHNRYDLLRQLAFFEGESRDRLDRRPFLLCRSGGPGMARFGAASWSGDINCSFETFEQQVAVGLNMGLSGVPFWGTDIGGFYQVDGPNAELLVRWFQYGAFCPLFRLHGHSHRDHLPWAHGPAIEAVLRRYLELRSRLMPYTYTLAWQAHRTGMPLMRPMVLHDPGDARTWQMGHQYLWGDDLLVAPVTREGARHWAVYLPPGRWFDWWTQTEHRGPG
ncbi:MAG: glycoside hydrolase family 31 protein, partial [Acetobacteraceae bacterium]|nr:glycoside hydrolase family 31 protein [Acetobacteraceae bacterium]